MKTTSEQLQAFVTVYETNSFSEAAKKLSRHRSSVSQIVSFLEEALELKLFHRRGKLIEPTPAASELYFYAKQSIKHTNSFELLASSLQLNKLTKLSIGYSALIPKQFLVNVRKALKESVPDLSVDFYCVKQRETKTLLENDEIQFAIVEVDERDSVDKFERAQLAHMFFNVMASKDHELRLLKTSERLEVLKMMKQIVFHEQLQNPYIVNSLLSVNHEVVNDLVLMFSLINEGEGWGILPRTMPLLHSDYKNIVIYEIDDQEEVLHIPFSLWNKRDHRLNHLRTVILNNLMETRKNILSLGP